MKDVYCAWLEGAKKQNEADPELLAVRRHQQQREEALQPELETYNLFQ